MLQTTSSTRNELTIPVRTSRIKIRREYTVVHAVYFSMATKQLTTVMYVHICSASKAGLKAPPNLYVMMATLLARSHRYAEIALFVSNKVSALYLLILRYSCLKILWMDRRWVAVR